MLKWRCVHTRKRCRRQCIDLAICVHTRQRCRRQCTDLAIRGQCALLEGRVDLDLVHVGGHGAVLQPAPTQANHRRTHIRRPQRRQTTCRRSAPRDIAAPPRGPSGVAAFMSAHNKTPYITPSMEFPSGNGVVWGRRGPQLEFSLSTPCAA